MRRATERSLLLLLAAVQFTHIMDFMIVMPLGPQLMRELEIGPQRFSALVAAYTLCAGTVGLLAAPFLDRFDRRSALLFTYAGFGLGTLACGLTKSGAGLLLARGVCGGFGGVSGALVMAIVGDVVPPERRAAAMGMIMTAFSFAAAIGVPFGLFLAQHFRWEAPFLLLGGLSALVWILVWVRLPAMRGHRDRTPADLALGLTPMRRFLHLLQDANAGSALLFMASLVFAHFVIIPLMPEHLVRNLGVPEKKLFLVYLVGGLLSAVTGPLIGRWADRFGRVRVYAVLVAVAAVVTGILVSAGPLPLWGVLLLVGAFFVFASGRFVPGSAIMSLAVPAHRRGAFMSLNACTRDLTAGFTSSVGGWLVTKTPDGHLAGYGYLGWLAVGGGVLSLWLASRVRDVEAASATGR